MNKVINEPYSKVPDHYSKKIRQLIDVLLSKDPQKRPSISNLIHIPEIIEEVSSVYSVT